MRRFIDMTPRWSELFVTWQRIVHSSVKVVKEEPMTNFWDQVKHSFDIADRYNCLVSALKEEGWDNERIDKAIERGDAIFEERRNKVHEEETA